MSKSVSWNQDGTCFGVATPMGFRIYDCGEGSFREICKRDFDDGEVALVELLYKTAIVALVGGGATPKFPPNKVVLWDETEGRHIGEITARGVVRAVRLRKDRIVVVLEHKLLVYNFEDLRLQHQVETLANPTGIVALSTAPEHPVLACPGLHKGQVRVDLYELRRTRFIQAHQSALQALALSPDGRLLATASEKGTLVRLYSTQDGIALKELRRGTDPAAIFSIAFSRDAGQMACSSDTGTVHVFATAGAEAAGRAAAGGAASNSTVSFSYDDLGPEGEGGQGDEATGGTGSGGATAPKNRTFLSADYLGIVKSILPKSKPINYLTSEWSFAHYKLPASEVSSGGKAGGRTALSFASDGSLLVASTSGYFYRLGIDPAASDSNSKMYPLSTLYYPG